MGNVVSFRSVMEAKAEDWVICNRPQFDIFLQGGKPSYPHKSQRNLAFALSCKAT